MSSLVTSDVAREMRGLTETWRARHAAIRPWSLKGKFTKGLGVERFEVVNSGSRCAFKIVRVRRGRIHTQALEHGAYAPDEEAFAQCARRFLCLGTFSGRFFARQVVKIDGISVTLFSKKETGHKNISISGPSHRETALDAAGKFFHLIESMRPRPLRDEVTGLRTPLPLAEDYYRVVQIRSWQTNQVTTIDFGDNMTLHVEGVRRDPRVGLSLYDTTLFPGCNIYPPAALGCSSIGIFDTAKATVLNAQEYWYIVFRDWVEFIKTHVTVRPANGMSREMERSLLADSWQRERGLAARTQ